MSSHGDNSAETFGALLKTSFSSDLTFAQTTKSIIGYSIWRKLLRNDLQRFCSPQQIIDLIKSHSNEEHISSCEIPNSRSGSVNHLPELAPTSTIPVAQAGGYQVHITKVPNNVKYTNESVHCVKQGIPSTYLLQAVDKLMAEFETLSAQNHSGLNQQIVLLSQNSENEETALQQIQSSIEQRTQYHHILNRVFSGREDVKWGRVVALLSFTVELVLREVRKGNLEAIRWYMDWGCSFITDGFVSTWIQQQPNGWEDLVNLASKRIDWEEEINKVWKATLALSLTGVAVYTTFKFLKSLI